MKKSLKIATAATVLTSLAFNLASTSAQNWTARTVEDVKASLSTNESGMYIIQWGDTLTTIAKATGYTVEQLAAINAIADKDSIAAGAVLYFDSANQTATYVDANTDVTETYPLVTEEAATYVVVETPEWVEEASVSETPEVKEVLTVEEETTVVESFVEEVVPAYEEVVVEETELPVVETTEAIVEETEVPVVTEVPVIEETVVETTVAPVIEETVAPVVEETTVVSNTGLNEYGGIISEAKEWIAMKESGGQYEIWNPSGKYYGRYQLTVDYLNGDLSRENQEKVADEYVLNRYGSWEAAKEFWLLNNWY